MATLDPFDLVKRLGHVPLEPLVDVLRRLHGQGTGNSAALLEELAYRARVVGAPTSTVHAAPSSSSPDYEAARRHFVRHAEKLREQAVLAEKLLDGFTRHSSAPTPFPLQQELRIRCVPGTESSAAFVVVNGLERGVDVRFRPGHVHGVSPEASALVRVAFDPEQPQLERGAECRVRILIEVPAGLALPDPAEFSVDVLGDDRLLLKLWVRMESSAGGGE